MVFCVCLLVLTSPSYRSMYWNHIEEHREAAERIQRHMRRVWEARRGMLALAIMKTYWRRTWAANHIQVLSGHVHTCSCA